MNISRAFICPCRSGSVNENFEYTSCYHSLITEPTVSNYRRGPKSMLLNLARISSASSNAFSRFKAKCANHSSIHNRILITVIEIFRVYAIFIRKTCSRQLWTSYSDFKADMLMAIDIMTVMRPV